MKEELRKFLESNLLEDYLLGTLSKEDNTKVEFFIDRYPEVKQKFNSMEEDIERLAKRTAISTPADLKSKILNTIEDAPVAEIRPLTNTRVKKKSSGWTLAASFAALAFSSLAFYFWNQNSQLKAQLADANQEIIRVKNLNKGSSEKQAILASQFEMINDANTDRFVLKGNAKAKQLTTIAYWNREAKAAYLKIDQLPTLKDKKCFQLWADVDGEMISLGVIAKNQNSLIKLPFKLNAESLNITIEKEGGSDHPDVSNLVASILI